LGTYITACLSLGLAGYAFVFGTLILSAVVDIYYNYSLTVIFHPVDLVPIPLVLSILQTVLIVAVLVIVSYYILKSSWKDLVEGILLALGAKPQTSSPPPSPPPAETESSESKKLAELQPSDSPPTSSALDERRQELLAGIVLLMIAGFLGYKIYEVYFASAPRGLGYLITAYPLPLKLPILGVILVGTALWAAAVYLLKEALKEFRWLEQTQLAYRTNQHKKQDK
jgi:hypothetical protein